MQDLEGSAWGGRRGGVAQWLEQSAHNRLVPGSNPGTPTTLIDVRFRRFPKMALSFIAKFEASRPFTKDESWMLFRIAAFSEAIGWTILISGVLINRYNWPGSKIAIPIAGRIHGTVFLIYFFMLVATYGSLGWSRKKILLAALAGIPPYGTLIFERWAAQTRLLKSYKTQFQRQALTKIAGSNHLPPR